MVTDGDNWRAPRRRIRPPVVLAGLAALAVAVLVAATVAWLVRDRGTQTPAPPAPPSGPRPLTVLEVAGINALLAQQTTGAHSLSGTISVNGRTLGLHCTYLADGTAGSGTLTAGGLRGDVLIDAGAVYLRGDEPFWSALGVSGSPPPPGWVILPPDFLGGKVFVSPQVWTAALQPTEAARLDAHTYYSGHGNASAVVADNGITHFSVDGVSADVRSVPVPDVVTPAQQLGAGHGPGAPLGRGPGGNWTLSAPAPAPTANPSPTTTSTTPTP
ncbi:MULTISPECIES: hypothetical protein [Mycobacterium avium complex (MAC)]|uniref:Uncharacterized protein n=1 Tax=Mycobacterium intracellulare subsp. chimaera TaxID=222805 RepID=A0ABT7P6K0_MYCIT|nr:MULTISPECIES: hypothetical protein [Mycobacterium avium complex (MAC)]MDM3928703.1 hypothetical protein [Mycobacterium intracellulare subsp. chimaera]PBA69100.1 hypothetical protein CKJ76_24820 [Mycobacterium avium]